LSHGVEFELLSAAARAEAADREWIAGVSAHDFCHSHALTFSTAQRFETQTDLRT